MARGRGIGLGIDVARLRSTRIKANDHNKQLIYARTQEAVDEIAAEFLQYPVVGFDIETAATNGYGYSNGVVRLYQFAAVTPNWHRRLAVADLFHTEVDPLLAILRDPNIEKDIQNSSFEQIWTMVHHGLDRIENVYDPMIAADEIARELRRRDWEKAKLTDPSVKLKDVTPEEGWRNGKPITNLAYLMEKYMGIKLGKENQASWWGKMDLSAEQINYAALDPEANLDVSRKLKQIAASLGPDVEAKIKERCDNVAIMARKVADKILAAGDETNFNKASLILMHSESTEELEIAWMATKQTPLNYRSRRKTKTLYRKRLKELAA